MEKFLESKIPQQEGDGENQLRAMEMIDEEMEVTINNEEE
jgi:hypothetical protein